LGEEGQEREWEDRKAEVEGRGRKGKEGERTQSKERIELTAHPKNRIY